MLSILIPTYNYDCTCLVRDLQTQAQRLGIGYEVIVADDLLQSAVDALLAKHPAEQPVFCYYPVGIGFPPDDDAE